MRKISSLVLAALLTATPLAAQKRPKEPKRPRFDVGVDTNDWKSYWQYGLQTFRTRPDKASEAFYWASRLDPSRGEPLYALWAASWASRPQLLREYMKGADYALKSKEAERFDSLFYAALIRNPFVHQGLERNLLAAVYDAEMGAGNWEWSMDSENVGWLAYTEGRFPEAVQRFGQVLAKSPGRHRLREIRARAFQAMQQHDSAVAELTLLVQALERANRTRLVYAYQSKTIYLYSIGIVHQTRGDHNRAREVYGQALAEDLSFYMAHAALGSVALAQGDTATALSEYDQAVQLNGGDPVLRYNYGVVLSAAQRHEEAAEQFRAAIELEPYFANSYLGLGSAYDAQGKSAEAIEQLKLFLARAPRSMGRQITVVKKRLGDAKE